MIENSHIPPSVGSILIADFNYDLPEQRIAVHPLQQRDACKLMLSRPDGVVTERKFTDLPALLPSSALLICNNTRVINARLSFHKSTGSRIEIFMLEPVSPADYAVSFQSRGRCSWACLVGNSKRWKDGVLTKELRINDDSSVTLCVERKGRLEGGAFEIEFSWNNSNITLASIIEAAGNIPIPPYLNRESEETDNTDYQTVYSRIQGSVAAPTAGLHFTDNIFADLHGHNILTDELTLHVGAGTFQPVKSEQIGEHPMHRETFTVTRHLLENIIRARKEQRDIVAVGTTSVRTLESLPLLLHCNFEVGQWTAYSSDSLALNTDTELQRLLDYMSANSLDSITAATSIMIAPGFRWRLVQAMVTNFHQPQSTLLLLVSSFLNRDENADIAEEEKQWRKIYAKALQSDFRFLSYGDACLLFPLSPCRNHS